MRSLTTAAMRTGGGNGAIPLDRGVTWQRKPIEWGGFGSYVLAAAAMLIVFAPPASATFAGRNGKIAYVGGFGGSQIHMTDFGQLTFPGATIFDESPVFSPDGSRVAFVRRTGNSSFYVLMTINADGTDASSLITSASFGELPIENPAWADNQRISFAVSYFGFGGPNEGIWTIGGPEGLTQTIPMPLANFPNWSPARNQLLYTCSFRTDGTFPMTDLCIYDADTGSTLRQFPVNWPGRASNAIGEPTWTPDGERIVFSMSHYDGAVRNDIFSVSAVGTGLTKLTDSGPSICPTNPSAVATYTYQSPSPSPDGQSIVAYRWTNRENQADPSGCHYSYLRENKGLYTISASGDGDTAVHLTPLIRNGTDWQPVPASLTVNVNDGHGNPLKGLKVELLTPGGTTVNGTPSNIGGKYLFDSVAQGVYTIRATLTDNSGGADSEPAFTIRHTETGAEPVWIEVGHVHGDASQPHSTAMPFDSATQIVASNVPPAFYERLDDLANIYFRLSQYVGWVKEHLTANDELNTVDFHAFASQIESDDARYIWNTSAVMMGELSSDYADAGRPMNGEWHEYTHHLYRQFVVARDLSDCAPFINHAGYFNADTCDSMDEGFAMFLPTLAAQEILGTSDAIYADFGISLDNAKTKPWSFRERNPQEGMTDEDFAVAGLFWDLVDNRDDTQVAAVIGADGLTHQVSYTDPVSISLGDLWNKLKMHPPTVFSLRQTLGTQSPTIDLDGDGIPDIAPLDEVFLLHGFFPIDLDQIVDPGGTPFGMPRELPSYRYDVAHAHRIDPSIPRNALVGFSSHRVYSDDGGLRDTFIPRLKKPSQPSASVELNVRDASGVPLAGATVNMNIQYPTGRGDTISRRLTSGSGALVHLELPPYFDYLLPIGASIPACDPEHDFHVQVTLSAEKAGIVSKETHSFDNCAYQHAVSVAAGPAALSYAFTIPVQTLTITSAGSGLGQTTGGGTYQAGQTVSVSATPYAGSVFTGWSGTNAAECASGSVLLNSNKNCTATFDRVRILTTNVTGTGSGNVTGGGVYVDGEIVTVTATPFAGSVFTGWSGPDAAECTTGFVLMNADKSCTANFALSDGTCQPGVLVPLEVRNVAFATDKVTIGWAAAPYATSYDMVRGSVAALPVGPAGGDEACLGSFIPGVSTTDDAVPTPGTGFYYVVRGKNACGQGTYGSQSNGAPQVTTTCPDCPFIGYASIAPGSSPPSLSMSQQAIVISGVGRDMYTQARLQISKSDGTADFDQTQGGIVPNWGFAWTPGQGVGTYVATASVTNSAGCTRTATNTWTVEPADCSTCVSVLSAVPDSTTTPQYYRLQNGFVNNCSFPLGITDVTIRESNPTNCTHPSCSPPASPMKLVKIQYLSSGSFADETSSVAWTSSISGGSPVAAPSTSVTASFPPPLYIGANTSGTAKMRLIFNTTTPIWNGTQSSRKHLLIGDFVFTQSSSLCAPTTTSAPLN